MRLLINILMAAIFVSPPFLFGQKINKAVSAISTATAPRVFEEYIRKSLPEWKSPGMSVVVVRDNQVVFEKAFGVADLEAGTAYTTATLSTCASTTKAMTAACMGMLVDEGLVKWDDPVEVILPEFKLSNPYLSSEIKVRDLFTHNTGLGNADLLWVFGYSREEIIRRMQFVPPAYSLRASYIYQNLMYIVAGEVIRKISGKTWDEFITERIFRPLQMKNTFADYSQIPALSQKTKTHFKDPDQHDSIKVIPYLFDDNIGAAGGVWSSANDMGKWLRFLLDSGRVDGKRLLQPATLAELFKPQAIVPPEQFYPTMQLTHPHWTTYGLGWFQQDYRGKMVQFHTGSLDGLVAIAGMIPSENMAIYIFANLDHVELRHALMFKAFDLWCFHDNENDWSKDFLKLYTDLTDSARKKQKDLEEKRIRDTKPSLPLFAYAGKYSNEIYGDVQVDVSGDSLLVKFPNNLSIGLTHWNFDTFRGYYNNWWFGKTNAEFMINGEGRVTAFSAEGITFKRENPK